jgi:hypothetical protein
MREMMIWLALETRAYCVEFAALVVEAWRWFLGLPVPPLVIAHPTSTALCSRCGRRVAVWHRYSDQTVCCAQCAMLTIEEPE